MGACEISFIRDGTLSQNQIEEAFRARQQDDRAQNGHQDGYSGDFQTVNRIEFRTDVFETRAEAMDYCLSEAQKWDSVIAVMFKDPNKDLRWLVAGWGAC